MKINIKKSIKYLLLFTLGGTLFLFYLLPSIPEPTFERIVKIYGGSYLSILSGTFSVWWSFFNDSIIFKGISTLVGILLLSIWGYLIKKESYPFWILSIPIFMWVFMGWFFLFAEITASI